MTMQEEAQVIIRDILAAVQPDAAVRSALSDTSRFDGGRLILVAIGKAAWQMAAAAQEALGERIERGIVITKYGHVKAPLSGIRCLEAGHPVPDENSYSATAEALAMTEGLSARDTVLFLISGGGSALFEKPLIPPEELADITGQLLASGADIRAINTIRKRLSAVKGGRFAQHCAPAQVYSIVLSDIIGDPLDMIASGPAAPDSATCADARAVCERYGLRLSDAARACLDQETPKILDNVETCITGSVDALCNAACGSVQNFGYAPIVLTTSLDCEAREAGSFFAAIARYNADRIVPFAYIAGGETIVHVSGQGKGGRNQELALAAALGIEGLAGVCLFSLGSDGTDGPTDAAGGIVDGHTIGERLSRADALQALSDNDSYHALEKAGALLKTGPTGTNVNDVTVLLLRPTGD